MLDGNRLKLRFLPKICASSRYLLVFFVQAANIPEFIRLVYNLAQLPRYFPSTIMADQSSPPNEGYPLPEVERQLLEGCLKQDRRAQRALYERYKDAMYTLAYRITGDFDLAHDVLQEAFLAVFRGIGQFRRASTLGAWIRTIVVRTAYKKLKRSPTMEPLEDHHTAEMIDWGDYLDATYLEQAIQALPAGYRSVFVLIEIEGYAHKEVAEMLGISVGTSKSQLYHAKKYLKKTLKVLGVWQ